MTMQPPTDAIKILEDATDSFDLAVASERQAARIMALLMALSSRAQDGEMEDEEPAAAWPLLDAMRKVLDEIELDMMNALSEGRSLAAAAELTNGRYPTRQSFHRRRKEIGRLDRRTLTGDYRRGAAVPKPKPEPVQPDQTGMI